MSGPSQVRCAGCGVLSEVRELGHTPEGWGRDNGVAGGRYWCPECKTDEHADGTVFDA